MVNLLNGHLVYFGNRGYGWSSITRVYSSLTTANAYGLDFYTSGIRPSYDQNYRFRGFPVRCLVYKFKKRKTLYFVRSGSIYLYNSSLVQYGFGGTSWSSSAVAYGTGIWDANAYSLKLYDSGINPSNGPNARWYGIPVRCLVILVLVCVGELEPLYFVHSGNVDLNNGSLRFSGGVGYDWSRSAVAYSSATSASSYWFDFNSSVSRPSTGPFNRYFGFPVRCLV